MRYILRKCVVCGTLTHKSSLLRFVRSSKGELIYDKSQKAAGRGAYLCNQPGCLQEGLNRKRPRIFHALKIKVMPADLTTLKAIMVTLSQQGLPCKEVNKNE